LVDELVALAEVDGLMAVGSWYERFEQLDDAQVKAFMDAGRRDRPSSAAAIPPRGTAGQL
jgi:predicted phosphoribosyltransferase